MVQINQKLRGWINYFGVGTVSRAYGVVNHHVTYRLRRWLCAKHKVRGPGYSRFPDRYLYRTLGLFQAPARGTQRTVSARVNRLVREPGAGNPPARFDERGVETGHGRDGGTPADERAGQQGKTNLDLNYRATPRLYYGSRESGGVLAPRLVVERPDGTRESLLATADAMLIGYIPRGSYGGFRWLALSLCRSNFALIRFGPVNGPVRKAEIVLRSIPPGRDGASPIPPPAPFEIGAYEVREPWDERRVSWDDRPTAAEEPAGSARRAPGAAEVRIDVTASAARLADPDAAARGWLIQVVRPMPWEGPEPGAGAAVERDLLKLFTWADSVPEAVRKARAERKLVLACVRSEFDPTKTSYLEQVLLAAVLADPDVMPLVWQHFVPVRVCVNPAEVTMDDGRPGRADPLAGLGTSLRETKPTALVISDGERRIAALTNMGTFDRDLVLRLLFEALARGPAPAAAPPATPWAQLEAGRPDEARRLFARMGGPEGEIGQARAASLLGDHEAALRHARPLTRSDGQFRVQAAVVAGRALLRLGRPREAVPLLREATGGGPGFGDGPTYDLGCALLQAGEPEAARVAWRDAAARFPHSPTPAPGPGPA